MIALQIILTLVVGAGLGLTLEAWISDRGQP